MKKSKIKPVIASMLCAFMAMNNVVAAYAAESESNGSDLDVVQPENELLTMTDQEMHNYKMWLLQNQEHEEEISESPAPFARARAFTNENDYSFSGACGDNLTFNYDQQTKTLSISGTGKMWGTNNTDYTQFPWNNYKTEIEYINIDNEVTYISANAFNGFNALKSIDIPASVEEIGVYAFGFCHNLQSASIHAKFINQLAFYDCTSLSSVDLTGVESIAWHAFRNCYSLSTITIPDSVQALWEPFFNCTALESVNVSNSNDFFASVDGVLFNKDITTLYYYPSNKSSDTYNVPSTVEEIVSRAFACSKNLVNPVIPENCKLGDRVFESSYFIEHWYDHNNAYRFHANNGYYYLIINDNLLSVKSDNGTPVTTLDFTNSIHNSTGTKMINKVDLQDSSNYTSVTNVISDYWVDIQSDCLSQTQWYNNNDLNVIYNDNNPEMASYKLLYSYHGDDTSFNAETFTHIGARAFSNWRVENNGEEVAVDIYLSSNNTNINCDSLSGVNIGDVFVDSAPIDIEYIKIPSEVKEEVGAKAIDEFEGTFKYNLALAVASNWDYFDKLAEDYCSDILADLNIDQYNTRAQKIKVVYDWMRENLQYNWWNAKDENGDKTYNGQNYSVFYSLTYRKSAHLLTGYGVCASYSDLFNCFMKVLGIPSIYVVNSGINIGDVNGNHAWNLVEVDEINHVWYYTCVTNAFFLKGQLNFNNDIFVGYRNADKDDYDYISKLFPSNGFSNDENTISDYDFEMIVEKEFNLTNAIDSSEEVTLSYSDKIFETVTTSNNIKNYNLYGEKSFFNGTSIKVGNETVYTFNTYDDISFDNDIIGTYTLSNGKIINYSIENNNGLIDIKLYDSMSGNIVINDNADIVDYYIVETHNGSKTYTNSAFVSLAEPISIRFYDSNNVLIKSVDATSFNEITGRNISHDAAYRITSGYDNNMPVITLYTYTMGDVNMNGILDDEDSLSLLRYIVEFYNFVQTGSTGNLNLGNGNLTINGDISANGTLTLNAMNANINGQLSASNFVNNISGNLNMNKPMNNITIDEYVKDAFTDERMNTMFFKDDNTNVISDDYNVNDVNITLSDNTAVDGNISLNGNVNINSNLKADGDIDIIGNVENTVKGVIYSKNGDITLDSNNINFNGFIYAPNGTVTITGSNVTIKGTIIAESLIIEGDTVNFNVAAIDEGYSGGEGFGDITLTEFQLMLGDMNYDSQVDIRDVVLLNRKKFELAA